MKTNTGLWLFLRVTAVSAARVRTSGRRDPGHRHGLLHWSTHRLYRGAGMSAECFVSIQICRESIKKTKIHLRMDNC